MKDQIERWFSAPVFEGDQEKSWRASLLNAAIVVCVFVVILVVVGNIMGGKTPTSVFVIDGVMLLVLFSIRGVLLSGRVSLAGVFLIVLGIGLIVVAIAGLGTIRTPTTAFLMLIVIIAGLTFGKRGLLLSAGASSLSVLGLILAENAGLLPRADTSVTITQWISYTVAFGLTGMLTNFAYRSMQQSLERAFNEMTERGLVEEELRRSETRLKDAERIAQLGHWDLDLRQDKLYWSDEIYRIFEMSPSRVEASYDDFLSVVHPDDREWVDKSYTESLETKIPYRIDHRVLLADGRVKYVQEQCETFYDEQGNAIRSIGTIQDITERKRGDEQLRKLSRAVEAAPVAIVITDTNASIEYVNPFFTSITGYENREVIDANPSTLKSGKTPPETYSELWKTIRSGKSWQGEFINKRKDGSLFIEAAKISPIFDREKNITHFVAIKQDITDRKNTEEREREQRNLAEALRNTAEALNSSLELEKILDTILENVEKVIQFDAMHIAWLEEGQARIIGWRGYTPEQELEMNRQFTVKDFPTFSQVIETRQPLVIPLVEESPIWRSVSGTNWVRSHIKVPILINNQVVGILSLHSKTPGFYNDQHAQTVKAFANQVGIAVRNSMLYEEVQNLATVDELTRLYNRRGFFEISHREIARLQRFNRHLSAIFVDIDHFKQFNDRHSYEVGDQVLRLVAQTLQQSVREIDVVGRYGGEEMIILLPEIDQTGAIEVAERLRTQVEKLRVSTDQGEQGVTASFGVATLVPEQGKTAVANEEEQQKLLESLIAKAGGVLHFAKQQGRNRVAISED